MNRRPTNPRHTALGASPGSSHPTSPLSSRGGSPTPGYSREASPGLGLESSLKKSGHIQMTIQHLADEQERVQKKTFTNWMNSYLVKGTPPIKIENLFEDIKDGTTLLALLQVLSGEKLPMEKGARMKRLHFISNVTTALRFLESKKIRLVNINPSDVVDGKPSIVLGLIWTIILYFQIEEHTRNMPEPEPSQDGEPPKKKTPVDRFKGGAKKAMLGWAQKAVQEKYGVQVKDFGQSWRDGIAFNALIHNIRPELVDMNTLHHNEPRVNLENAFTTAETHLGIARLIDPEDVDVDKPDEKSIMTYVAQFLKAYPDPSAKGDKRVEEARRAAEEELRDYSELIQWLDKADEILQIVEEPLVDLESEYMQYLAFSEELKLKYVIYEKFRVKIETKTTVTLTEDKWTYLQQRWDYVTQQTKLWLWKLDSGLPGRMSHIAQWLHKGEVLIETIAKIDEKDEDILNIVCAALEEHRAFFKDIDSTKAEFKRIRQQGICDGQILPAKQMQDMDTRFEKLTLNAAASQRKLEYDELKYRLLSLIVIVEAKLKSWTVKYGLQGSVEDLLTDYVEFVHTKKLFEQYEQTYKELKRVGEVYKRQEPRDQREIEKVNKYARETTEKWNNLSVEVRSVQTMLEEVIQYWKRYNACADLFSVWLPEAEKMVVKSSEERGDFFEDLSKWRERHSVLNESGNFLIETCEEKVAADLKQNLLLINRRWKDLLQQIEESLQRQSVEQSRKDYGMNVAAISSWLENADAVLAKQVPCGYEEVKEQTRLLDALNNEEEEIEVDFKNTSKLAQSLVKDSTQDVINSMLGALKTQKDKLVKIRREIPERLKTLKTVLSQVESLEHGISDLQEWVRGGEELLQSHKIDNNMEITEGRLEKHKAHFAETTYYKQMLESKNKVFQKISKYDKKGVNTEEQHQTMAQLNQKFQTVVTSAREWEQRLELVLKLWRTLYQRADAVEGWLEEAEAILTAEGSSAQLVIKHKQFFERVDQSLMQGFLRAGQELLQELDETERRDLQKKMASLQARWKNALYNAPMRLMKLEFQEPEETFVQNVAVAEDTIKQQRQQIEGKADMKELLRKHKVIFQDSPFFPTCTECLQKMKLLGDRLIHYNTEQTSLRDKYDKHAEHWEDLKSDLDRLYLLLQQLPERWHDYNQSVGEISDWLESVNQVMRDLEKDNVSPQEYKENMAKFQKLMKMTDTYGNDLQDLGKALEDLLPNTSPEEAREQQEKLQALIRRFKSLNEQAGGAGEKSAVTSQALEFRAKVEKRLDQLKKIQNQAAEEVACDSLAAVKNLLAKHEGEMSRFERDRSMVQSDLQAGHSLKGRVDAPAFLQSSIDSLDDTWDQTASLQTSKHEKLKEAVKQWEAYENQKAKVLDFLKAAEAEMNKVPTPGGQEVIQKELETKQRLLAALEELQPSIEELQQTNSGLQLNASEAGQQSLTSELTSLQERLQNVGISMTDRISTLNVANDRWGEFYQKLNDFSGWLNQKEADLNQVSKTASSPEEQYNSAKVICSDIYDNHSKLEELEKECRDLSQGFRSRETANVKSKVANLRRQWESLCSRAKEQSSTLSSHVGHWHQYQNTLQTLLPWMENGEKYLTQDMSKCGSLQEAKEQHQLHQVFLSERDEHEEIFDKLTAEASHITDQPGLAEELRGLQRRWSKIVKGSDERTQKLQGMHEQWVLYEKAKEQFEDTIDKYKTKLSAEPNVDSIDPAVLERELGMHKALQEEMKSQQPVVASMAKQIKQLQPFLTPLGGSTVSSDHGNLSKSWEELNANVGDKIKALTAAQQERKDFYDKLDDFEKWQGKLQRKLDGTNEIYGDEADETGVKLQNMKGEAENKRQVLAALRAEVEDLCSKCSPEEAESLREQFKQICSTYDSSNHLMDQRIELCQNWGQFQANQKEAQKQMKRILKAMESPDLKQEDLAKLNAELAAVRKSIGGWNKHSTHLDKLMTDSKTIIKDRGSLKSLHFKSQLQSDGVEFEKAQQKMSQKEGHLVHTTNLWGDFREGHDGLMKWIRQTSQDLHSAKVGDSTLEGLKDLREYMEKTQQEVDDKSKEIEALKEVARQLMAADPSRQSAIQENISDMDNEFENLQALISEKIQYQAAVIKLWQQYEDARENVQKALNQVTLVTAEDVSCETQADIKVILDKVKAAEFEMSSNHAQLDYLVSRGQQLVREVDTLPQFESKPLQKQVKDCNDKWNQVSKDLTEMRQNLEAQLVLWDQVNHSREEIDTWLESTVQKMKDSIQQFGDAVSVENLLDRYKGELPYFKDLYVTMTKKLTDLKRMNKEGSIPTLEEAQQAIEYQFERASHLADELEEKLSDFTDQRSTVESELDEEMEWLIQMKENLAKIDDISGSDEDILARLQKTKALHADLEGHRVNITNLQDKLNSLGSQYQSAEAASLAKDVSLLSRKYEAALQKSSKVEEALSHALEAHAVEAQQEQQRLVNSGREKAKWCADPSGDKYSVEAKLSAIEELLGSIDEGEVKTKIAAKKVSLLQGAVPQSRRGELEHMKSGMQQDWQNLVDSLMSTKAKLQGSMTQWKGYDENYENFSQWLKEKESQVRSETGLRPDLRSKIEQLDRFKMLYDDVSGHKPELDTILDQAKEITLNTGDTRTVTFANQLNTRYHTLASKLKEQVDKFDQGVEDHQIYDDLRQASQEWLRLAREKLTSQVESTGDKDDQESRLYTIKELQNGRDQGLAKFNAARESGEKLYPNTSADGRESIRQEVRTLQADWENYCDSLNDAQRHLETSLMQWSSYEDGYENLVKWIQDMEYSLQSDIELKTTLQEKKTMLQHYKSLQQDVLAHQSIVDSVEDKAKVVSSATSMSKVTQLKSRYKTIASISAEHVKTCEEIVDNHQQFSDGFQQARDWLTAMQDRLAVCSESAVDKHGLQNKLDRLQELISTLPEGEAKVAHVKTFSERTVPQTTTLGQTTIRQKVEALLLDWQTYQAKITEGRHGLEVALQSWIEYEGIYEKLASWLKDIEAQTKEFELKSTHQDKQVQVEKLKALQQDILGKQPEFDEFNFRCQNLHSPDSRHTSYTSQLNSRYQVQKNKTKELIGKWEEFVREHAAFLNAYGSASNAVDDLQHRLEGCADTSGDKLTIEDKLAKIQELNVEKEQIHGKIQHAVELGEKIFPNTGSEGRESVRQELRTLREMWESFSDQLSETQRRLEVCLLQWSSYDETFEQIHRWLLDAKAKLKLEAELKSTLQEKKMQLQNLKVLHQDILSHQHSLDSLSSKAENLAQSTSDSRIEKLLADHNTQYRGLCHDSENLLRRFENNVTDHQEYHDALLDCQDWINTVKEKAAMYADVSGDHFSVQNKLERLEELIAQCPDSEAKIGNVKTLSEKTSLNTSPAGCELLKRECNQLNTEWNSYVAMAKEGRSNLQKVLEQWKEYEESHDALVKWMKVIEGQVKDYELSATLQEKQTQVEKYKAMKEEIISRQGDIDKFIDKAQVLVQASNDVRLNTYISQVSSRYQVLVNSIKDLITKWERFVLEHENYSEKYSQFTKWMNNAEGKLQSCSDTSGDKETLERRRNQILILMSEKDQGLQRLNMAVEAGEKLYPDTASNGRDKIRQELRSAKESWDNLTSNLNDCQRRFDTLLMQWTSFMESQGHFVKWLTDTEAVVKGDVELKGSLQEKRAQLQNHKSLLQDVQSHQRVLDAVMDRGHSLLQTAPNPEVEKFMDDIQERHSALLAAARGMIHKTEDHVKNNVQYQESYQAAVDWLNTSKDKLGMCSDLTGDRHSIQNKLEKVQALVETQPEGEAKVKACEHHAAQTITHTAVSSKHDLQREVEDLKQDWLQYSNKVTDTKSKLEKCMKQWQDYDSAFEKLTQWLKDMERKVKDFSPVSTVDEKQAQLAKYQQMMATIKTQQYEADQVLYEAQALTQSSSETRVITYVSQLSSRFQSLTVTTKEIIKKCEQMVMDHQLYEEKYRDATTWVAAAKSKYAACKDLGDSREALDTRMSVVKDLIHDKDVAFAHLNQATEAGEKLYPNTAAEGRETIRQELRSLKQEWESLYDEVITSQRKMDQLSLQWTSYDESFEQVESWLHTMETHFRGELILKATLDEKKTQLHTYRNLYHDVISYQRVIDNISDKAQSLAQTSSDPQVTSKLTLIMSRYQQLCSTAKERMEACDQYVQDHHTYVSRYNDGIEWLNSMRERLTSCSDITGDRHAIQSRLERLMEMTSVANEGEPKLTRIVTASEIVIPNTAPHGKDNIIREVATLKSDWESFTAKLAKTRENLERCAIQWQDFEDQYDWCATWLKEAETKLRDVDFKATLKEKETELEALKSLLEEVQTHQADVDNVNDKAQIIARTSGESRVTNQSSQMNTRYQTLLTNTKEAVRRWDQYISDHKNYQDAYDVCVIWQKDVSDKLEICSNTAGSKEELTGKLNRLQELTNMRDDGFHKLQQVMDRAQLALPNTSPPGKDSIRSDIQTLQHNWDRIISSTSDIKNKLDSALAQFEGYSVAMEQIQSWLSDAERAIKKYSTPQATLSEKRTQLEKVKALQVGVTGQQHSLDSLKDKVSALQHVSPDPHLVAEVKQLGSRYSNVADSVQELQKKCENQMQEHQNYQEAFVDARDWLNHSVEKLDSCGDVRGDRHSIEAKLQKIQDLQAGKDAGEQKIAAAVQKGNVILPNTAPAGEETIREDLDMLSQDWETFLLSLANHKEQLEQLLVQWSEYDSSHDKLNQWLRVYEQKVKAGTETKATLDEKEALLQKQTVLHNDIENQQAAFDALSDRVQALLQSSTDSRVTTQLTQLNSRYTALLAKSKDLLKKLEQFVQDHEEYKEVYVKSQEWIRATSKRLAACGDTSGDKDTIQEQLENLQEFVLLKDEGQNLIHSTQTWGDKVMTNTSLEGRDLIRQELQTLQREWDVFVSSISDTRIALETCLLQWSDYAGSYEQIHKWFKDMEKKLGDIESKSDLGEKKAQLQKVKGLHQDIVAFHHMVDSVSTKAQDLVVRSPASKVTSSVSMTTGKYDNLLETSKELVKRNEEWVEQHQTFHDASNSFNHWLRSARERMATCSDTYGDKPIVTGKLEKLKALTTDLDEGQERLNKATKLGEATIPNTATIGHGRIRQDIQDMADNFEDFRLQLRVTHNNLEMCLTRWHEYESIYEDFSTWLKQMDELLKTEKSLQATLQEKQQYYEQYQAHIQMMLAHQAKLDEVNHEAQALLEVTSDARVSHAITQMTTRYQTLLSHAKEITKSLETHYSDHRIFSETMEDFSNWLLATHSKVKLYHDLSGTKEDIEQRLSKLRDLQSSLDQGHSKLRSVIDSGERTIPNTNATGTQTLRKEIDSAKAEYDKLKVTLSDSRTELESTLSHWGNFDRAREQLSSWLRETEAKLKTDSGLQPELAEKKSQLEKFKIIQKDITAHQSQIDVIKVRSSQLMDPAVVSMTTDITNRYEQITGKVQELVTTFENHVKEHEAYRNQYMDCMDWLAVSKHKLQRLNDCSGDKAEVMSRLKQVKDFKNELAQGQGKVTEAAALGEGVIIHTAQPGPDTMRQEIRGMEQEYSTLQTLADEINSSLTACVQSWENYEKELEQMSKWLTGAEQKLSDKKEIKMEPAAQQQHFKEIEALHEEVVSHKPMLDRLTDKSEEVLRYSADHSVSSDRMQLATRYQALLAATKEQTQKLDQLLKDQETYKLVSDDCVRWLEMTNQKLKQCNDTSGDIHAIDHRLGTIKEITQSLDDGLQKLNSVCELADKICQRSTPENKKAIEEQVTKLKSDWDKLNKDINSCSGALEGALSRFSEFNNVHKNLSKWLSETENTLLAEITLKSDLAEKKTQLEKFKTLQEEVDQHQEQVDRLTTLAEELQTTAVNPELQKALQEAKDRYGKVKEKVKGFVTNLDQAHRDHITYQMALQECEKWILQMSFRLMSHNSLNTSSLELTKKQIGKHSALIQEISGYQGTIDKVTEQGQQLIMASQHQPQLVQQIQTQLSNLEDSYMSLHTTANQIKGRLAEVLQRWEEYQAVLQDCDRYLKDEVNPWQADIKNINLDNLDVASTQLNIAQDMLERLYQYKQEIATRAHTCENIGSMESLDQVDQALTSSLTQQADQVNSDLDEAILSLEGIVRQLKEGQSQWESLEKRRAELADWLADKQEEVDELQHRPAKLHTEAAELDVAHLRELYDEVNKKAADIDRLASRYARVAGQSQFDHEIEPLRQHWSNMMRQIQALLENREAQLQMSRDYHNMQQRMGSDMDVLRRGLDRFSQDEDALLAEHVQNLQQRPSSRCKSPRASSGTQTPKSIKRKIKEEDEKGNTLTLPLPRSGRSSPTRSIASELSVSGRPKTPRLGDSSRSVSPRPRSRGVGDVRWSSDVDDQSGARPKTPRSGQRSLSPFRGTSPFPGSRPGSRSGFGRSASPDSFKKTHSHLFQRDSDVESGYEELTPLTPHNFSLENISFGIDSSTQTQDQYVSPNQQLPQGHMLRLSTADGRQSSTQNLRVTWEGESSSPPRGASNMVAENATVSQTRSRIPVRSPPRDQSGQLTRSLPVPAAGRGLTVNRSLRSRSPATEPQQQQQQGNEAATIPVNQSQQRRGLAQGSAYHYGGDQTHGSAVSGTTHAAKHRDSAASPGRPHAVNTSGFKMYSGGSDSVFMSDDNNPANAEEEDEDEEYEMRDLSTQTPRNRGCQTPGYATTQTPRKWREKDRIEALRSITPQTTAEQENNNIPLNKHLNGTRSARIISPTSHRSLNDNSASNPDLRLNGVPINNATLRDALEQSLKKGLRDTDYGDELPEYLQQYEQYISSFDKDTTLDSTQEEHTAAENMQNAIKASSGHVSADDGEDLAVPPSELTHTIAQFLRDYKSESDAGVQSEHSEVSVATTTSAQRELLARHHFSTQNLPKMKSTHNTGSPLSSRSHILTRSLPNRDLQSGTDTWPGVTSRIPVARSNSKSPSRSRNKSRSPARRSPQSVSRNSTQMSQNNNRRYNATIRLEQKQKDASPSRSTQSKRRREHGTARWVDTTVSQTEAPESETTDYDDSSSTLITDDDESGEKVETRDFQMQTPKIGSTQTPGYAGTQTRFTNRDTDNDVSDIENEIAQNAAQVNHSAAISPTHCATQTVESRLTEVDQHLAVDSYVQTISEAQTQTPSHSTTQTDDMQKPKDEGEVNEKHHKHKSKSKHKSSKHHKSDSQSVVSTSSRKSKKDLIKVILNDVKDLKTQVDEKIKEAGGKPREAQEGDTTESELERIFTKSEDKKRKHKHKHKHKHRDSSKEKHKHRKEKSGDRVTEWVSDIENHKHHHRSRRHGSPTRHHDHSGRMREESPRRHRYPPPPQSPLRGPVGPPSPHHMMRTYPGPPPPVRGPPPPFRGPPPPPGHFPQSPQMMPPAPPFAPMAPAMSGPNVLRPVSAPAPGNIPSPVLAASSPYLVIRDHFRHYNDAGESSETEVEQHAHRSRSRPKSRQPHSGNGTSRNEINENIAMATMEANKLKQLTEKMAGSLRDALN